MDNGAKCFPIGNCTSLLPISLTKGPSCQILHSILSNGLAERVRERARESAWRHVEASHSVRQPVRPTLRLPGCFLVRFLYCRTPFFTIKTFMALKMTFKQHKKEVYHSLNLMELKCKKENRALHLPPPLIFMHIHVYIRM